MVVSRNANVPATWFRAGRVVWELVIAGGNTIGLTADELWFDQQVTYLPPSSLAGNDIGCKIYIREFMPLVTASYGQLFD